MTSYQELADNARKLNPVTVSASRGVNLRWLRHSVEAHLRDAENMDLYFLRTMPIEELVLIALSYPHWYDFIDDSLYDILDEVTISDEADLYAEGQRAEETATIIRRVLEDVEGYLKAIVPEYKRYVHLKTTNGISVMVDYQDEFCNGP